LRDEPQDGFPPQRISITTAEIAMKRLYRSETEKKVAGLCGGLGEYFDVDPTLIRLLTVVLGLITAVVPLVVAYVIAWIIVPTKPSS
jgi:phage shock protein C